MDSLICDNYLRKATITKVRDGDTVEATIDLGYSNLTKQAFRLIGIDTAEIRAKDPVLKALGLKAKEFVTEKILGKDVWVKSIKFAKDTFGSRYLAVIYYEEDGKMIELNQQLLDMELAVVYEK